MSIREKNDEERNVRGNSRCGLFGLVMKMRMWVGPCSEIGPAVRASSRCAGGIVIIVCSGGRLCALESGVAYLSSPFRTKKKRDKVFGGTQVRLKTSGKEGKRTKKGTEEGKETSLEKESKP